MRDDTFTTTARIVNLHPTKGAHWVMFCQIKLFYSYGFAPPVKITQQINRGIYSENQIQKNDSCCAAYCLYVFYLSNLLGFINAELNLYYQTFPS